MNECTRIVLRELEIAGIRDVEQIRGARHLQVRWHVNGGPQRTYTVPGSPSDIRTPRNVRADVRRLLRTDGVSFEQPKPPPPKQLDRVALLQQEMAALRQRVTVLEQPLGWPLGRPAS